MNVYYECLDTIKRAELAYKYLTRTLTPTEATTLIAEIQPVSEWYPLETFDVDNVIQSAIDRWGDRPELEEYAQRACRRVWNKWDSSGDISWNASEWALDLIIEYAKDDGIELLSMEDTNVS